jgi:effector-binding domain-containing protein
LLSNLLYRGGRSARTSTPDVDPDTGYRRYQTDQIPVAQVIRRFRDLEMPLEDIHAVLTAPDIATRNSVIASHLSRLEDTLERTRQATVSLRNLLETPAPVAPAGLAHLSIAATAAAAITETIDIEDAQAWYQGALGELQASLAAHGVAAAGPAGGIFSNALFEDDHGTATVFIPCDLSFRSTGRIDPLVIPSAELATTIHTGPHTDIDRSYGALATYVAHHALGVDGPIREYYLIDRYTTTDQSQWRTQIGWPIFHTARLSEPDSRHPSARRTARWSPSRVRHSSSREVVLRRRCFTMTLPAGTTSSSSLAGCATVLRCASATVRARE